MRKILLGILAILFTTNAHAWELQQRKTGFIAPQLKTLTLNQQDLIKPNTQIPIGLSYFSAFGKIDEIHSYFSKGSRLPTFTANRSATNPATVTDSSGNMSIVTSSNTPRKYGGYYDETGFHSASGVHVEGAGTNLLIRTDGTASGAGLWTGWTETETLDAAQTVSQVAIPELTSISGAYSQRIQYTANVNDTNETYALLSTNSGAGTVVQNDYVTYSCWLRSQTGISNVNVKIGTTVRNAANGYVNAYVSDDLVSSITTAWRRLSWTKQITDATADRVNFYLNIVDVDNGETLEIEIYGVQVEKAMYPSTWIPTSTAALTRNAETLTGIVSNNFPPLTGNNCLSFDGTNDVVTFGNLGNITNVTMRVQQRADNQELFTVDNTANGAVTVVAGVLTYGATLTAGTITVDGVTKSAAQAGVLLNDNNYHTISMDLTSVAASDFRLGTNATDFGDLFVQTISATGHNWLFNEGTGTNLADSVGANAGTSSGCTWSKDATAGTIILKYRPVMLPSEQAADYKNVFNVLLDNNNIGLRYLTNADNKVNFRYQSNSNSISITSSALSTWTRYQSHVIAFTYSTTADSAGKKGYLYIDGVSVGTPLTSLAVPAGALPTSFSLSPSTLTSEMWEAVLFYPRMLSANEILNETNRLNAM